MSRDFNDEHLIKSNFNYMRMNTEASLRSCNTPIIQI